MEFIVHTIKPTGLFLPIKHIVGTKKTQVYPRARTTGYFAEVNRGSDVFNFFTSLRTRS